MSRTTQIVADNILLSVIIVKVLLIVGVTTIALVKVLAYPEQEDQHIKVILIEQNSYNQPSAHGHQAQADVPSMPQTQEASRKHTSLIQQHDSQDITVSIDALIHDATMVAEDASGQPSSNHRITQTTIDVLKVLTEQSQQHQPTEVTWAGDALSEETVLSLASQHDWDVEEAVSIIFCESGRNPDTVFINHETRDYSIGLFQINLFGDLAAHRPSVDWLLVPENNVAYAYKLWFEEGWKPWRNCASKLGFLP